MKKNILIALVLLLQFCANAQGPLLKAGDIIPDLVFGNSRNQLTNATF